MKWIAAALAVLVAGLMSSGLTLSANAESPSSFSLEVRQGPLGPDRAIHPLYLHAHGRDAAAEPQVTSPTPHGYTPAQVQAYLGLSGDGSGQTVAIVDAFDDPNAEADLNAFSAQFGLPQSCGSAGADPGDCFTFRKATPQGTPTVDAGWSLEIALDLEWAHAVAPKASILLVESADNGLGNLLSAIDYAAGQPGVVVISNSWGANEFSAEFLYDSHCNLAAAVCTAASGDSGNPGIWPAYDPYALAVGGTSLVLGAGGAVTSETAWSGSGGGQSKYEARPAYQNAVNTSTKRGIPDVSYDADPNTGFAVYDTVAYSGQTGWFQVGGTSAGAPQWAAIIAVADQLRGSPIGSANFGIHNQVYALATGLADITSGTNGGCGSVCTAKTGYDFVTGLGSPRAGVDAALGGSAPPPPTPDFSLSATPTSRSVTVGTGTSYTIAITPAGGFAGSVSFGVTGAPAGVTASFSPNPATSSATLSIGTSASTPAGTYSLTVTGTSGALVHTTAVSLTVTSTAAQGFTVSASPAALTIRRRSSGTVSITIRSTGGFSGPVALSMSGLPAGASARFGASTINLPANGTATTSVRISTGFAARGTYNLVITGKSGSATASVPVTLTIN